MRYDDLLPGLRDVYANARNVKIRTVQTLAEPIFYVRYTVGDGTVLMDKWIRANGARGARNILKCVATRRVC